MIMNIDPIDLDAYLHLLSPEELRECVWHPVDLSLEGNESVIERLKNMERDEVVLAYSRSLKLASVLGRVSALLSVGFETSTGLHIALDDASRADMGAMATTALAASSGAIGWPYSYKLGWITVENERIEMPEPADGLAIAAQVGDYYAGIRQNARSIKDALVAAVTHADLDEIDIESGWP